MTMEKKFQAINLSCKRQQQILFANISFELKSGEALFIEGPNGSGKSSLLRLLTGLSTPTKGEIYWQNQSIQYSRLTYWENLHYVSHQNGIKLGLTVMENLQLMAYLSEKQQDKIEETLSLLQLSHHQHTPTSYLSAGQKRRLALAKLWLFPKIIWILDEPCTALDAATQILFLTQLETHLQNGGISVMSSHHAMHLKNLATQTLSLGIWDAE